MKTTENQQVMKHTENQQVKNPLGKTMKLTTDGRIKHTAIRILRTLQPKLGRVYADGRKNGIRYKISYGVGSDIQSKQALVHRLNRLYELNNINAIAYIHEEQNMYRSLKVCILIKK